MSWITNAYAMGTNQQAAGGEASLLTGLMPFVLIFVVFYFLLIRPQQKKAKAHREMLAALKKGDAIITAGGLYGRILEARDDVVVVDLGDSTVTMSRGHISGVPAHSNLAPPARRDKKVKKSARVEEIPAEEPEEDDIDDADVQEESQAPEDKAASRKDA